MEGASLRLEEGPPGDEESKASKKQRKDEQRRRTRARQAFLLVFLVAILVVSKLAAPAPASKQVPGDASRHGALQHEEGRGAPAWHSQHPSNWTSSSGGRPKVTDAASAFSRWVDAGSFAAASHGGGGGEGEGSAAAHGPAEAALDAKCYGEDGAEYDGAGVAMWGKDNIQPDSAACCASCRTHSAAHPGRSGCAVWVFCASAAGCGGPKRGECWGKTRSQSLLPVVRSRGQGWVSGALLSDAEAAEVAAARAAGEAERAARRTRPTNPRVFLDVSINGGAASRMEFVLYATEAPRAAENFRAMCTGEKGGKLTFSGMRFYRIIDQFIDQAGVNGVGSIWGSSTVSGSSFDDDPGGLALRHDTHARTHARTHAHTPLTYPSGL